MRSEVLRFEVDFKIRVISETRLRLHYETLLHDPKCGVFAHFCFLVLTTWNIYVLHKLKVFAPFRQQYGPKMEPKLSKID